MPRPPSAPTDSPDQDEARQLFIATFASQWESIRIQVDQIKAVGPGGPAAALEEIATRLRDLARSIGFLTVSARASELAELASGAGTGVFEPLRANVVVDAMMEAFSKDLASAPSASASAPPPAAAPAAVHAAPIEAVPIVTAPDDVGTPPAGAVRTAVIADDDPDVTRIVDAQMRAAGYQTILAFDGDETLAAVRAHNPDILVLDLMMPKRSGFDVLAELRDGAGPRPRTIVLSALAREEDTLRAFELGADDYMTKPFNPQELIARITRLLK